MKSLKDFLTESEQWVQSPAQGDSFDIELAPDQLIESYVLEVTDDGIVLNGDTGMIGLLESYGHTVEDIKRYGATGSNRGMGFSVAEDLKGELHPEAHKVLRHIDPQHHHVYKPYLKKGVYKGDYRDRADVLSAAERAGHLAQEQGMLESPEDRRQLSKKEREQLRMAGKEIFAMFPDEDKPNPEMQKFVKKQIKTRPMAGPKGHLPEQGVAEGNDWDQAASDRRNINQKLLLAKTDPLTAAKDLLGPMFRSRVSFETEKMLNGLWDTVNQQQDLESQAVEFIQKLQKQMSQQGVAEGAMKDIDIAHQDYQRMTPQQFFAAYKMTKAEWMSKHKNLLPAQKDDKEFKRVMELAGIVLKDDQDAAVLATKELDTAIDNPMPGVHESSHDDDENPVMAAIIRRITMTRPDLLQHGPERVLDAVRDVAEFVGAVDEIGTSDVSGWVKQVERNLGSMTEAEYQGRKVPLGKPMRGDVKKFKVYVKDPATGNIKKVNFGHGGTSAKRLGQKTMKIKKSNPARRKSFRARHNCDNPGPRTKARYWSCRAW